MPWNALGKSVSRTKFETDYHSILPVIGVYFLTLNDGCLMLRNESTMVLGLFEMQIGPHMYGGLGKPQEKTPVIDSIAKADFLLG